MDGITKLLERTILGAAGKAARRVELETGVSGVGRHLFYFI